MGDASAAVEAGLDSGAGEGGLDASESAMAPDAARDATLADGMALDGSVVLEDGGMSCRPGLHFADGGCIADNDCPEGCSGHGTCSSTRTCTCSLGYVGADCAGCASGYHRGADGVRCTTSFCDPNPCASGVCGEMGGSCCAVACTLGQAECAGGQVRTCVADPGTGCPIFGAAASCGQNGCLDGSRCAPIAPGVQVEQWGGREVDLALSLAIAPKGEVVVAGTSYASVDGQMFAGKTDMVVTSRKPGGVGNWTRQRGNGEFDAANALVRTPSGELYVGGRAQGELVPGDGGEARAVIYKLSANGEVLWIRRWGSGIEDDVYALVRDAAGNLYAGGLTHGDLAAPNAGVQDAFVTKLDAEGAPLWSVQWGTTADDWVYALALDSAGNVYAAGHTYGMLASGGGLGSDVFLVKVSPAGKRLWTRQFGAAGADVARGVAVAADGNVYVCGYGNDLNTVGVSGAYLSKWSAEGERLWLEQWGSSETVAYALTLDAEQAVYVAGWHNGPLDAAPSAGNIDAFVMKWADRGGTRMRAWSRQFGTAAEDQAYALGVDADGTLYVAGGTMGSFPGFANRGKQDNFLLRIAP